MNCVRDEFPTSSLKYEFLTCYNLLRSKYISDHFIFEQLICPLLQERETSFTVLPKWQIVLFNIPYIDVSDFTKQDDNNCELNNIYNVTTPRTGPLGRFIAWTCKNPEAYTWPTLKFGQSVRWVERKSSDLLLLFIEIHHHHHHNHQQQQQQKRHTTSILINLLACFDYTD